uniref:NUDIX domain-containing protein n=1 Tax=Nocardia sp. NRRL WC-3656 TaxID=1463824 RepID=UPI0018CC61E9
MSQDAQNPDTQNAESQNPAVQAATVQDEDVENADIRDVADEAAENIIAAASQYLAISALLDSVVQINRLRPNSCVNNAVTGMRVLCPDNAGRFQMPAARLRGHGRDTVRKIFGAGLEQAGSLDQVAESLKSRPGGITVLVYKWKDSRAAGTSVDADDHMVLLVNDSTSVDDPNLVVVDLAASRDGNTENDYGPKDLRNRRALLNKAVGFDDWRREQQKFIDRLPVERRLFETIEFDRDGNLASGSSAGAPAAETLPPSQRAVVPAAMVDEINAAGAGLPSRGEPTPDRSDTAADTRRHEPAPIGNRPHEPSSAPEGPSVQEGRSDDSDARAQADQSDHSFRILDDPGMSGDREVEPGYWGHYGAAGVLVRHVNRTGDELFLICKSKSGFSQGNWQLPGGALCSRETPAQGAAREMSEELGASAEYLAGLAYRGTHVISGPRGWKYHVLVADAPRRFDPAVDDKETAEARWVSRDELAAMAGRGEVHSALTRNLPRVLGLFEPDAAEPVIPSVSRSAPAVAARPPGFRPQPAFRALDRTMFEEYVRLYEFGRASFDDPARTAEVARRNEEFFARYPQARQPAVAGQLVQYQAVAGEIDKLADALDMNGTDLRARLKRELADLVQGKALAVRIRQEALFGLLADGRFKTQFEGPLGGGRASDVARMEDRWFGNPENMDPRLRPVYGHVLIAGERPAGLSDATVSAGADDPNLKLYTEKLAMYGRIELVLKDDVRERATVCVGDSLVYSGAVWGGKQARTIPSPLLDPQPESFGIGPMSENAFEEDRTLRGTDRDYLGPLFRRHQFVECHIHGGLTLADIDHINLPEAPDPELRAALDRAGVAWRVLDSHAIARSGDAEDVARERRRLEEDLAVVDNVIDGIRRSLEFLERGDTPAQQKRAELWRVELRNAEAMRDRIVEMLAPLGTGPSGSIGSRPTENEANPSSPNIREQYTVRAAGAALGPSGREGERTRTHAVAAERH